MDGSVIAVWVDNRCCSYEAVNVIYAQRITSSGLPLWTPNGIVVAAALGGVNQPVLVSDAMNGAIVASKERYATVIYAHHITAAGSVSGGAIATGSGYRYVSSIDSDGSGGGIVAWSDTRGGSGDIYVQRVRADGTVDPAWTHNGVALCTAAGDQVVPMIVSDGAGGAIATWYDKRSGSSYDIYAQHVLPDGAVDLEHCCALLACESLQTLRRCRFVVPIALLRVQEKDGDL